MQAQAQVGLGFRRDLAADLLQNTRSVPHFIEVAPENWVGMGGSYARQLRQAAERYPVVCHGLSLSLGAPDPIDWNFLAQVKEFLHELRVPIYSEHLSFNSFGNAHLYDLLPIPFRLDAARHVAQRIAQVQDFLGRRIAIENVSYYTPVAAEMSEADFIREVLQQSDCELLLDVNNVYVNSVNHGYDARNFIDQLPLHRVAYLHMAGHLQVEPYLIIDTHGEAIAEPVYDLLAYVAGRMAPKPILLERDFNYPHFDQLVDELQRIQRIAHPVSDPVILAS